jgi:hypothetical protein
VRKTLIVFGIGLLLVTILFTTDVVLFQALPLPGPWQYAIAKHNSVYMPGFSRDKYGQIEQGMTKERVVEILGPPFGGMPERPFCPSWSYANPQAGLRIPPFARDLYVLSTAVCFDINTGLVNNPRVEQVFFN